MNNQNEEKNEDSGGSSACGKLKKEEETKNATNRIRDSILVNDTKAMGQDESIAVSTNMRGDDTTTETTNGNTDSAGTTSFGNAKIDEEEARGKSVTGGNDNPDLAAKGSSETSTNDATSTAATETKADDKITTIASASSPTIMYEHQPSAYELQRMERIKRNRAYLASLGLEKLDKKKRSSTGTATSSSHKRQRTSDHFVSSSSGNNLDDTNNFPQPARKKSSRLKGKDFTFNEGALLRKAAGIVDAKDDPNTGGGKKLSQSDKKTHQDADAGAGPTNPSTDSTVQEGGFVDHGVGKESGEQKLRYRDFVYKELKRLQKVRRENVKLTERLLRRAKHEKTMVERDHTMMVRKQTRQKEFQSRRIHHEVLRRAIGSSDIVDRLKEEQRLAKNQADAMERDANIRLLSILAGVRYEWPQAIQRVEHELDRFVLGSLEDPTNPTSSYLLHCFPSKDGDDVVQLAGLSMKNSSFGSHNRDKNDDDIFQQRFKLNGLPRDVHGPVATSFVSSLDTTWLDDASGITTSAHDNHNNSEIEPTSFLSYVPQADDIVLYYPKGHKEFLSYFPSVQRQLPSQAASLDAEIVLTSHPDEIESNSTNPFGFFTELDSTLSHGYYPQNDEDGSSSIVITKNDTTSNNTITTVEHHPVICRVVETWAEYPSSEYHILENGQNLLNNDSSSSPFRLAAPTVKTKSSTKSSKRSKTKNVVSASTRTMPMALFVQLEVVLLTSSSSSSTPKKTFRFGFQLFPTHKPFLIPVEWAHRLNTSLKLGTVVQKEIATAPTTATTTCNTPQQGVIMSIESITMHLPSNMMDHNEDTEDHKMIDDDHNKNEVDITANATSCVLNLPQWDGITVKWKIEDESIGNSNISTQSLSAWEFMSLSLNTPPSPNSTPSQNLPLKWNMFGRLPIGLCSKIERTIRHASKTHEAAEPFVEDVTEDIAPSYTSFVPIGMSITKMLKRCNKKNYYRSVSSVLEDVKQIYANCVLYNHEDSIIVRECYAFTTFLAKLVIDLETSYYNSKENVIDMTDLNTSWLSQHLPDHSWRHHRSAASSPIVATSDSTTTNKTMDITSWIPQVGDQVYYSPTLHEQFLNVHGARTKTMTKKNESDESGVGRSTSVDTTTSNHETNSTIVSDWMTARITRAQPVFLPPKSFCNKSILGKGYPLISNETFDEESAVFRLTLMETKGNNNDSNNDNRSDGDGNGSRTPAVSRVSKSQIVPTTILWRPCLFSSSSDNMPHHPQGMKTGQLPHHQPQCCKCGFPQHLFLKPMWFPKDNTMYVAVNGVHSPRGILLVSPPVNDSSASNHLPHDGEKNANCSTEESATLKGPNDTIASSFSFSLFEQASTESVVGGAMQRIYPLLQHLRYRCQTQQLAPDEVDPNFSKLVLSGLSSSPSSSNMLACATSASTTAALPQLPEFSRTNGLEEGMAPPPTLLYDAAVGDIIKPRQPSSNTSINFETYFSIPATTVTSPAPSLCLDLIMLRIEHGYYRQVEAAIADINEAFLLLTLRIVGGSHVLELLRDETAGKTSNEQQPQASLTPTDVDPSFLQAVRAKYEWLRKVYSVALLCFCSTSMTAKAFGFVNPKSTKALLPSRPTKVEKDLERLIAALDKDPKDNYRRIAPKEPNPTIKIKLKVAGSVFIPPPSSKNDDDADDREALNDTECDHDKDAIHNAEEKVTQENEQVEKECGALRDNAVATTDKEHKTKSDQAITTTSCNEKEKKQQSVGATSTRHTRSRSSNNTLTATALEGSSTLVNKEDGFKEITKMTKKSITHSSSEGTANSTQNAILVSSSSNEADGKQDVEEPASLSNKTEQYPPEQSLTLPPELYEKDTKLLKVLFGKPGRNTKCVRCVVTNKQPFLICRVRYRHSNLSLSRKELETHGTFGQVLQKYYEYNPSETATTAERGDNGNADGNDIQEQAATATTKGMDADQILQTARVAYERAEKLHNLALEEADAPPELSDRFIKAAFPVDPDDNHYTLCCVCGYGGNLFLCEGCPTVAHAKCYGVSPNFEGDWYCRKCTAKKRQKEKKEADAGEGEEGLKSSAESSQQQKEKKAPTSSNMTTGTATAATATTTTMVAGAAATTSLKKPFSKEKKTGKSVEVTKEELLSQQEKELEEMLDELKKERQKASRSLHRHSGKSSSKTTGGLKQAGKKPFGDAEDNADDEQQHSDKEDGDDEDTSTDAVSSFAKLAKIDHLPSEEKDPKDSNITPGSFVREPKYQRCIYFTYENDIVYKIGIWCGVSLEDILFINSELHEGIMAKSRLHSKTPIVLPLNANEPDRSLKTHLPPASKKKIAKTTTMAALAQKKPRPSISSTTDGLDSSTITPVKRKRGRPRKSDAQQQQEVDASSKRRRLEDAPSSKSKSRSNKSQKEENELVANASKSNNADDSNSKKKQRTSSKYPDVPVDNLPINAESNVFTRDSKRAVYFAVEDDIVHMIAEVCEVPLQYLLQINKKLHPGISKRSRLREYTPIVLPPDATCPDDALYVDPTDFKYPGDESSDSEDDDDNGSKHSHDEDDDEDNDGIRSGANEGKDDLGDDDNDEVNSIRSRSSSSNRADDDDDDDNYSIGDAAPPDTKKRRGRKPRKVANNNAEQESDDTKKKRSFSEDNKKDPAHSNEDPGSTTTSEEKIKLILNRTAKKARDSLETSDTSIHNVKKKDKSSDIKNLLDQENCDKDPKKSDENTDNDSVDVKEGDCEGSSDEGGNTTHDDDDGEDDIENESVDEVDQADEDESQTNNKDSTGGSENDDDEKSEDEEDEDNENDNENEDDENDDDEEVNDSWLNHIFENLPATSELRPLNISLQCAVLDHVLWPSLKKVGWAKEIGPRPTDVTYCPPKSLSSVPTRRIHSIPSLLNFLKEEDKNSTREKTSDDQDGSTFRAELQLFEDCMVVSKLLKSKGKLPTRCTAQYLVQVVATNSRYQQQRKSQQNTKIRVLL